MNISVVVFYLPYLVVDIYVETGKCYNKQKRLACSIRFTCYHIAIIFFSIELRENWAGTSRIIRTLLFTFEIMAEM